MKKILQFEYRLTFAYLLIGGLWILFSDRILLLFITDAHDLTKLQTYKGWFYVVVTALMLLIFLQNHLSKLRKAEAKARESDALKTAFLQNISHEIRTPMNGILGFAALLNNKKLTEEKQDEYIKLINRSANYLLDIVNDVLDISIIESGNYLPHFTPVNINQLLDEVHKTLSPIIKPELTFELTKDLPDQAAVLLTDELKLRQILHNLINNANKFTEAGYISFGYRTKGIQLEFYVEDTGPGIPESIHEIIFERFRKVEVQTTRLFEGIGLGLAIVKANLALLKGKIWLHSKPGKGSTFYFTIPYIPGT